MSGKESLQEEFFHTFNSLMDKGSQIIISSDRTPMKLDRIQKQYDFMINNKDCVVLGGQCEIMNETSKKIICTTKHKDVIDKNYLIQEVRNFQYVLKQ